VPFPPRDGLTEDNRWSYIDWVSLSPGALAPRPGPYDIRTYVAGHQSPLGRVGFVSHPRCLQPSSGASMVLGAR